MLDVMLGLGLLMVIGVRLIMLCVGMYMISEWK